MSIDLSVIVCTFNRGGMLGDTLRSWRQVRRDDGSCELIVVDNASSDDTASVVRSFAADFRGTLRYVYEAEPGLSHARNRGIREAAGKVVAFVDDDIYFEPAWVGALLRAFDAHPDVHCVGGKSIPKFEVAEPPWITSRILKFYGSTQSGDETRPMVFPEHPFGVNMAFRREVFDTIGGFRTDLGRKKNSLLSDEEKEFFHRASKAGLKTLYAADAVLYHRVPEERVSENWLVRRAYWQGISNVLFDLHIRNRSRLSLLKSAYRSLRNLALGSNRGDLRGIWDYYRTRDISTRMYRYSLIGTVRQSLVEFLRLPKLHGDQS